MEKHYDKHDGKSFRIVKVLERFNSLNYVSLGPIKITEAHLTPSD